MGKLPLKGSAFLTAEGSSKSSLAISSPAYKNSDCLTSVKNKNFWILCLEHNLPALLDLQTF